ncbi:ynaI [Symbiodinium natans]|uniref:YnaI protein n=1 Tax=Symbiodinium natans TaxID=878477 RepID=A0A812SCB3_9DINO|nr:ynaI [Symbiodinium natans]
MGAMFPSLLVASLACAGSQTMPTSSQGSSWCPACNGTKLCSRRFLFAVLEAPEGPSLADLAGMLPSSHMPEEELLPGASALCESLATMDRLLYYEPYTVGSNLTPSDLDRGEAWSHPGPAQRPPILAKMQDTLWDWLEPPAPGKGEVRGFAARPLDLECLVAVCPCARVVVSKPPGGRWKGSKRWLTNKLDAAQVPYFNVPLNELLGTFTGMGGHSEQAPAFFHPGTDRAWLDPKRSIGIVEPLVNQLPRQERETFLGLLRLLSLPVDDGWFSAVLLVLVRARVLQYLVMTSQRWRAFLTTYRRKIRTEEDLSAFRANLDRNQVLQKWQCLSGRAVFRQGGRLVSPASVEDVLELGGFENSALNTEFTRNTSFQPHNGQPVYVSSNAQYVLCSTPDDEGKVWMVTSLDNFQHEKSGSWEGLPWQSLGALAVSPPDATLTEAPQTGWQEHTDGKWVLREEAGLVGLRKPSLPLQVRILPSTAPPVVSYRTTYVQATERPLTLWSSCFVVAQLVDYVLRRKASTKALTNRIINVMSRIRWLLTSTCACLALFRLIARWKERRSRGKAVISDVLGVQSSQREARLSALTILMQTLVLVGWWMWVLAICGIQVGRLLLSTSVGALLLGIVGRDVLSNMLSCLVIYLTQPFAQGDWITLEQGQDGWAEEIGLFYTKVIQWDKRPLYVPNFRIVQMLVQNNSRMTNRRIRFDLKLRLEDIPKVPEIVQEIKNMIDTHPEIDSITHRLVRWRQVGDYYASIWLSCYTKSTEQGIKLQHYIAVEQSVLERCAAIVYRHGADFAASTQLSLKGVGGQAKIEEGAVARTSRERELQDTREAVLKDKEEKLRERELEVERTEQDFKKREHELEERELKLKVTMDVAADAELDEEEEAPEVKREVPVEEPEIGN